MASHIRTIAILSAMSSELKPVTRALALDARPQAGSDKARGIYKGVTIITAVTRMGLAAAQGATEELFATAGSAIDHVFVVGIAGANDPALKIGEVVIPACVVDERDGILQA
jgi:nucleoside phosphorylase